MALSHTCCFQLIISVLEELTDMPKIITLTANTAIDWVIEVNHLSTQRNLIANQTVEFAAGKGINVAKAIESLGYSATVLGFVGQQSATLFNELVSDKLHLDYTCVDGKSRTNITLTDNSELQETHIRTSGFNVSRNDCSRLIENLESYVNKGDVVVLSGSLPQGETSQLYQQLIEVCHQKSAISFVDSSGESLQQALKASPFLIKPNQQELEEIVGSALLNEEEIIVAAKGLLNRGIQWVVVSRAEKGLIAVNENIILIATTDYVDEKIMTSIGCGDALVAGLAVGYLQNYSATEMIKLGLACGVANLFSIEAGRFDKKHLSKITPRITLQTL